MKEKIIFILAITTFISCSIQKKMTKTRRELGINMDMMYLKIDSTFIDKPFSFINYKNKNDTIIVQNRYLHKFTFISQTEITNRQFNVFLKYLKDNNLNELYTKCKPDNNAWKKFGGDNLFYDSLSKYYHFIPDFLDFPIVNITYEAVLEYINWLNKIEPNKNIYYKLPNEKEWKFAFNTLEEDDTTFSWEGNNYRNKANSILANFVQFDQNQIRYDQIKDIISLKFSNSGYLGLINGPVNVYSYNPNMLGVYNISGNVAELIENEYYKDSLGREFCTTKGGSWNSFLYYLRKHTNEIYVLPCPYVGFRILKSEYKFKEID